MKIREEIKKYVAEDLQRHLSDKELLQAIGFSRKVLNNFDKKNLKIIDLCSMTEKELKGLGVGSNAMYIVKTCVELSRRFNACLLKKGSLLEGSKQVFNYFHEKLRDEKREKFFVVLLDSKHCIIKEELISIGSLNLSVVHPREVLITAIRESSESMLLVHNHPSGDPTPSKEDISTTNRLLKAGEIVGIRVLDHIIIGNGRYVSFLEENLI